MMGIFSIWRVFRTHVSNKYLKLSKTEGEDAYDGGKHETTEGDFCVCIRSITLHFEWDQGQVE